MTKINSLADRYAAAKAVADAAETALKLLKDEIKALGQEQIEGKSCFVNLGLSERGTLDGKAVVAKLGADWVKAHTKITLVERITLKNKPIGTLVALALENVA
jgi:hypothetical protein